MQKNENNTNGTVLFVYIVLGTIVNSLVSAPVRSEREAGTDRVLLFLSSGPEHKRVGSAVHVKV